MRWGVGASVLLVALTAIAAGGAAGGNAAHSLGESLRLSDVPPLRFPSRAAVDWCGVGQPTAVDRLPNADLSSPRQVHVTYAVPADAPDQSGARVNPIATDIDAIDAWWRGQDATRTLRFDLFSFPGCTSTIGKLDIGFVRLPRVGALYVGQAGTDRLMNDLSQLAALSTDKNLVYYDGPNPFDEFVCGTSFVTRSSPTVGGLNGIAFVWLRSLCGFDLGTARIAATVAVHELIHGLGALVQGGPHECDPPDDGHVCDSTADILYPEANSQTSLATQALDVGRDDYYGHSNPTFDVQDSGWLSHLPQLSLAVTLSGAGGAVRLTSPTAFDCAASCTLVLDNGTQATLVTSAATGTRFLGWRGACSGLGACQVTMDAAKSVTAVFGVARFRLAVSVAGKGRIVSAPVGISCPGRCSSTFAAGATVRLRPTPAKGFRFSGWTGSCRGTGLCLVPIDRDKSARAVFRRR